MPIQDSHLACLLLCSVPDPSEIVRPRYMLRLLSALPKLCYSTSSRTLTWPLLHDDTTGMPGSCLVTITIVDIVMNPYLHTYHSQTCTHYVRLHSRPTASNASMATRCCSRSTIDSASSSSSSLRRCKVGGLEVGDSDLLHAP